VAIQFEEMTSNRRSRDEAMADNAEWLLDQLPPNGKVVLWAHNGHVQTTGSSGSRSMGSALRNTFNQEMVVVGFDFARGSFNAYGQTGSTITALTTHTVAEPPQYSYEDYFLSAGLPRFLLELRGRDQRADTPPWLAGPALMRSIGAVYDDSASGSYVYQTYLPRQFDVIIFLENTSASRLLPFNYPPAFDQVASADAPPVDFAVPGAARAVQSGSGRQGVARRDYDPRK
jgi:erythromycin esterase